MHLALGQATGHAGSSDSVLRHVDNTSRRAKHVRRTERTEVARKRVSVVIAFGLALALVLTSTVAAALGAKPAADAFITSDSSDATPGETAGLGTTWMAPGNVIEPGVGVLGPGEFASR
jgi:hypothetical protein